MPQLMTRRLGEIDYTDDSVYYFPSGVPGFDDQRHFVFVHRPDMEPIIFMQSTADSGLCFILLPILAADPNYRLELNADDAEELRIPADRQPRIGEDVLCAGVVCAGEDVSPTVNLMAPIVVNIKDRIGRQIIRSDSQYSHRFPLLNLEEASCS